MNLDCYGAGCRCLLRIRENLGNPPIPDASFIAGGREAYPDWADRPGAADLPRLCEIAAELGISSGAELLREYDRILVLHRAGHSVLIRSRPAARAARPESTALVVAMDEAGMNLWIPTSDGASDTTWEPREDFTQGAAEAGIVLYAVPAPAEGAPLALGGPTIPSAEAELPPAGSDRWADWSATVIQEARQCIEGMSPRRWMVAHPDDERMQRLIAQIDGGQMENVSVELPRMIRWHSAHDGRSYVLLEFLSLSRQL
jgi:hypothetical protein